MRVLWFTSTEFPSVSEHFGRAINTGGGSWMKVLCQLLVEKHEIDLHIACSHFLYKKNVRFKGEDGITYHCIPRTKVSQTLAKVSQNLAGSTKDIEKCVACINDVKPDIIHIFGTEQFYGLISNRTKIPVVVRVQGILNSYISHFFSGVPLLSICRYPTMLYLWFLFWSRLKQERLIFASNRIYEGQSDWDRAWVEKLSPGSLYFRNAPIMRKPFYNTDWDPTKMKPYSIVAMATPVPYKGLHILLEALPSLLKRYPKITITLFGGMPGSGYGKYLKCLIKKYHLGAHINILGNLNESEMSILFAESHVVVHPSFIENESLFRLEALCVGVPTVFSYAGGMPSATGNYTVGSFFPPGDSAMLAFEISSIFEHYDKTVADSLATKAIVRNHLDVEKIIQTTIDMYQEILQRYNKK